jgi:hypothetical protein
MKEYTYTNKSYLGVKEGIVPPAPQYLWLNSKDNRLYKFGDSGWEVTNNAPYVVEEFTARDLAALAPRTNQVLPISRDFLDAMYKGLPIMVKAYPTYNITVPLSVDTISNPSKGTQFIFRVKFNNIEYKVAAAGGVITDTKVLNAVITAHNPVDWNENDYTTTGYIANRTHHLGSMIGPTHIGDIVRLAGTKGTHYFSDYKVLYNGKFYDLPPKKPQGVVNIDNYFKLIFTGYSESVNTSTYTFMSERISQTLPSQTFEIYRTNEGSRHKTLDELYLPDEAKPWKKVIATTTESGAFIFSDIKGADIAGGVNVIRNKAIYYANGKGAISISAPYKDSVLEFKILAGGAQNISFSGKYVWENGGKPDTTAANDVIYSFLVLEGKVYASAKVF